MDHVSRKLTFVHLSVSQNQLAVAILGIASQVSFVPDPLVIQLIEVGKVEAATYLSLLVVVDDSLSIELIFLPLTLIGDHSIGVVEHPISMHLVLEPLAVIVTSFLVEELPLSVSHTIEHVSLISGSNVVCFLNVHGPFSQR